VVESGIIPQHFLTVNAVSGYSGGGKGLIEVYQNAPSVDGEVAYPMEYMGLILVINMWRKCAYIPA